MATVSGVTVCEQLQAMRGLQENWDGYGGAAPQGNVLDFAQSFAAFLEAILTRSNSDTPVLHVTPTRVGGVLIEWQDNARQHEVQINPDHGLSFLHLDKATGEITTRLRPLL
jgi:hypothetical protein